MLDHPLRLAVGSHQAGSGRGCALNIISWENGDTVITDLPDCADPMLARVVQGVNDRVCTHRDGDLLCPECSLHVLALAHRLVGTGGPVDLDRRRVWVGIAVDQARRVLRLTNSSAAAEQAIIAAETWAAEPSGENQKAAAHATDAAYTAAHAADASASDAAYAAYAAASAASDAAYAAANASDASDASDAYAAASDAAYAAANASDAAANASDASDASDAYAAANASDAYGRRERLRLAHRAVDLFYELTGLTEHAPDPARTQAAYAAMVSQEPR